MVMCDGLLVPNAHRVLCKILAYRSPVYYDAFGNLNNGYKSFAIYQNSLRDTVMLWEAIGWQNVIIATAILKNVCYDEAEMILDAVVSWTHINEAQWLSVTTEMQESSLLPVRERGRLVVI